MSSPNPPPVVTQDQLQAEITRLQQVITRLNDQQHQIAIDAATSAAAQVALQASSASTKSADPSESWRKIEAPPLSTFSGRPSEYRNWRMEVRGRLAHEQRVGNSQTNMIALVYARLADNAQSMCTAFVDRLYSRGPGEPEASVDELLTFLDNTFQNRHSEDAALSKLVNLRQGSRSFANFIPLFERLLSEAGGDHWPEAFKIQRLNGCVSTELLLANASRDPARTMEELIQQYYRIAIVREQVNHRDRARVPSTSQSQERPASISTTWRAGPAAAANADPMDWEPTSRGPMVSLVNPNGGPGAGLSDDDQYRGKRSKWVSFGEVQRRRAARACIRCGRQGCRVPICPLKPAIKPNTPGPRVNSTSAYTTPRIDNAVEADNENGAEGEQGNVELLC